MEAMLSQRQKGQAKARPHLFLPRHPGDVVRLVAALAVLLVSIKLVNRNHIDEHAATSSGTTSANDGLTAPTPAA